MSKKMTVAVCAGFAVAIVAAGVLPYMAMGEPEAVVGGKTPGAAQPAVQARTPEAAGRYLVRVAGCNDCHTPGFMQEGEKVPESQWLIGMSLGFKGPWGTSYPANLRTKAMTYSEEQWVTYAKHANGMPPMPWPSLHAMSDADLRSVYRYIRTLGPSDNVVPSALGPGKTPTTPYMVFEPVMPK